MNRTAFNELIAYMRNRPEEARRLREVLDDALEQERAENAERWLTAKQAAELIGKSSRWIREHIHIFGTAKQVARGSKQYGWMMKEGDVRQAYELFIFQKTINA